MLTNDLIKEQKSSDISFLKETVDELTVLRNEVYELAINKDYEGFAFIDRGLEEVNIALNVLNENDEHKLKTYLIINNLASGLEDIDSAIDTIKKAALGMIKLILRVLDRVITFVTSFFNKGMTLTEKFFIGSLIRKRKSLEVKIDDRNGNKNAPLEISDRKIKKLMKEKDLFILTALKEGGKVTPQLALDYVRSTATLFTDNIILFDNTVDSLTNMLQDMSKSDITSNTFVGYFSEKNRFLQTALGKIDAGFKRNEILNTLINKIKSKESKDGFDLVILPLPIDGREKNQMGFIKVYIRKSDSISKLNYDDIKNVDELLSIKQDFIDYKDLGIDIQRLDGLKVNPCSYTEIDTITQAYIEASEKIKKKLNTDKITKKLEKLKKKLTTVNTNEFDSKGSNFKLSYLNMGITISTGILKCSSQLYKTAYCNSIRDYLLSHEV